MELGVSGGLESRHLGVDVGFDGVQRVVHLTELVVVVRSHGGRRGFGACLESGNAFVKSSLESVLCGDGAGFECQEVDVDAFHESVGLFTEVVNIGGEFPVDGFHAFKSLK